MIKYFASALLFVSLSAFSQNKEVDKRNGFKSIKLGTHISDFHTPMDFIFDTIPEEDPRAIKNYIRVVDSTAQGVMAYHFSHEKDLNMFFNDSIGSIFLRFDKSSMRLSEIEVINYFYDASKKAVEEKCIEYTRNLIGVLGEPDNWDNDVMYSDWEGDKCAMAIYIGENEIEGEKVRWICFKIISLAILEENLAKGF